MLELHDRSLLLVLVAMVLELHHSREFVRLNLGLTYFIVQAQIANISNRRSIIY